MKNYFKRWMFVSLVRFQEWKIKTLSKLHASRCKWGLHAWSELSSTSLITYRCRHCERQKVFVQLWPDGRKWIEWKKHPAEEYFDNQTRDAEKWVKAAEQMNCPAKPMPELFKPQND